MGISPKVNVIAWLKFDLASYNAAVEYVNHYTREIQPKYAQDSVI